MKKPTLVLRYLVHQVSFQGRKDTFLEDFTNNIQERYSSIVFIGLVQPFFNWKFTHPVFHLAENCRRRLIFEKIQLIDFDRDVENFL